MSNSPASRPPQTAAIEPVVHYKGKNEKMAAKLDGMRREGNVAEPCVDPVDVGSTAEAADALLAQIEALNGPGLKWVEVRRKAKAVMSPEALALLLDERPEATRVAGRSVWASAGRRVKEDARAIVLSLFKHQAPSTLFDIADTEPIRPRTYEPEVVAASQRGMKLLRQHCRRERIGVMGEGRTPGNAIDRIEARRLHGLLITQNDCEGLATKTASGQALIGLTAGHDDVTGFRVLAHEFGHHVLGHIKGGSAERNQEADKAEATDEVEAESFAYLVAGRLGVHFQESAMYAASYGSKLSADERKAAVARAKAKADVFLASHGVAPGQPEVTTTKAAPAKKKREPLSARRSGFGAVAPAAA